MSQKPATERRWLKSVIAASAEPLPSFPWMRGQRRQPEFRSTIAPVIAATGRRRVIPLFGRFTGAAAR